jgi:MFS family permease
MYLPSPLTGWLVDRYGRMTTAAASGITLLAAGILAAAAPGDSVALLALALALLGLGWNFGLVAGTAIITDTVPLATRAKTQGLVDVSIAIAGATGGMASGIMVAATSYPALALTGGILSLALPPMNPTNHDIPAPDLTVDGTGLLCVALLLHLGPREPAQGGSVHLLHMIAHGQRSSRWPARPRDTSTSSGTARHHLTRAD